ncbi:putative Protein kinase domain [Paratrimastix pyriformis]|uniref:non-specific serine/threonine protein kinase n=1 Tax=Paratrimastix pyriformis TaxID=342808 RepID=A0ABQ8UJ89_9EUKA|nr:putative Protein kinase domain [Paratrimastix pyriformis]
MPEGALFTTEPHQLADAALALEPTIGPHYRRRRILGAGAFGVTFLCQDTRDLLGRTQVVVKVLRPGDNHGLFLKELFLLARLRNEHILQAAGEPFEAPVELGGSPCVCLVTPYCEGGDLDGVIRRGTTPAERSRITRSLVDGLHYMHGAPIPESPYPVLHNDLKPANVLMRLNSNTGEFEAVLADLGLACQYSGRTKDGAGRLVAGTPGFMAPEVITTGNTLASDVYSLGCLLWCLYTSTDGAHRVDQDLDPDELAVAFAEIPDPVVRGLLVRMCARDPRERPTIHAVWDALNPPMVPLTGLPRKAAEELRASMGLERPIVLDDLGGWYTRLTSGDPRPTCPARALVGLLQCPEVTGRPATLTKLLETLANLCLADDLARTSLGQSGVATPLVELLKNNSTITATNHDLLVQLLRSIGSLVSDKEAYRAGVADRLIQLLRSDPDLFTAHPVVAGHLLTAIGNLAEASPEKLRRADGVAALAQRLTVSTPEAATPLIRAIGNLARDKQACRAFCAAGVATSLIMLLQNNRSLTASLPPFPPQPRLAAEFYRTLSIFASDKEEVRSAFCQSRLASQLEDLLGCPELGADTFAAHRLLWALCNLAVTAAELRTALRRVIPSLVTLLKSRSAATADLSVATQIVAAIGMLAQSAENVEAFGHAGVAAPLVDMLQSHIALTLPCGALALDALARLAVSETNRSAFARIPATRPLLHRLLAAYPDPRGNKDHGRVLLALLFPSLETPVSSLPRSAMNELRAALGRDFADGRPVLLGDLSDWYPWLTSDPLATCPARALVGLLLCPEVANEPAALAELLWTLGTLCRGSAPSAVRARTALGAADVACPLNHLLAWHLSLLGDPRRATDSVLAQVIDTTIPLQDRFLLRALANLALDAENSLALCSAGVPPQLVGRLTMHCRVITSPLAKQLLTAILQLLCTRSTSRAFEQAGMVPAFVGLLRQCEPTLATSDSDQFRQLLDILALMAVDHAAAFGRAGLAAPLVGLLTATPAATTLVTRPVFRMLCLLIVDEENLAAFKGIPATRPLVERLLATYPEGDVGRLVLGRLS